MADPICPHCLRRLPVGRVVGMAQVFCRHCKKMTVVVGAPVSREQA